MFILAVVRIKLALALVRTLVCTITSTVCAVVRLCFTQHFRPANSRETWLLSNLRCGMLIALLVGFAVGALVF